MNAKTAERRAFILGLAASGLSACGFQPRGMVELPPLMQRIHLGGQPPDPAFTDALGRLLRQNGGALVSDPAQASLRLTVLDYRRDAREVVIDPRARVRELELILRLRVKAEDAQGRVLLENESFQATRMMNYDPNNLLGRGEDEARLRADMSEVIAQSLLARLRAVAARTP